MFQRALCTTLCGTALATSATTASAATPTS